ncbi:GNAT family N-acetyltransferase [Rhizomicrobium electricum]|nr:GNAT family N-acetyltransferase [Rhizomicrobium electricum]NIJ47622.1 RimJ/RimL family protein N-acetyltransferase [Rhizomicrobium electricum]
MTVLLPGTDDLYAWMLGGPAPVPRLTLPPGGIAPAAVLAMLREAMKPIRAAHGGGDWLILDGNEAVGLISLKAPADRGGTVEIGYGIAASRWGRGHATGALALALKEIARDPQIRKVTAETATANLASQRVLQKNGFVQTGARVDSEDGDIICWERP